MRKDFQFSCFVFPLFCSSNFNYGVCLIYEYFDEFARSCLSVLRKWSFYESTKFSRFIRDEFFSRSHFLPNWASFSLAPFSQKKKKTYLKCSFQRRQTIEDCVNNKREMRQVAPGALRGSLSHSTRFHRLKSNLFHEVSVYGWIIIMESSKTCRSTVFLNSHCDSKKDVAW